MISVRSSLIKHVAIRSGACTVHHAASAAMDVSVSNSTKYIHVNNTHALPSSSSPSLSPTSCIGAYAGGSVRYLTSPAFRRYQRKREAETKLKPIIPTHEPGVQEPELEVSKRLPSGFSEMQNEPLLVIAAMGNHSARCECLRRHIMMIDEVDYEEAGKTLSEIEAKNTQNFGLAALPYKTGIAIAMITGIGAIPMVFSIDLAMWFNHHYVTMEIPEPSDLDTALETGAWTWNWMEPVLGTASFTLLAFQFSRAQLQNLGIKPFTNQLKINRAKKLIKAYPRYDPVILQAFVETDKMDK